MPDYLPPELIINYTLHVKILENASLDLVYFAPFLHYVSQLPVRWMSGARFPRKKSDRTVKLITYFHPVPMPRISGAITPFPDKPVQRGKFAFT